MQLLDLVFGGAFMTISQAVVTMLVAFIVWYGYQKNLFLKKLAFTTLFVEIILVAVFLSYQTLNGHVVREVHEEAYYAFTGMVHGLLSLYALAHAGLAFVRARKSFAAGQNYFREHSRRSMVLVAAWVLSLVTGLGL